MTVTAVEVTAIAPGAISRELSPARTSGAALAAVSVPTPASRADSVSGVAVVLRTIVEPKPRSIRESASTLATSPSAISATSPSGISALVAVPTSGQPCHVPGMQDALARHVVPVRKRVQFRRRIGDVVLQLGRAERAAVDERRGIRGDFQRSRPRERKRAFAREHVRRSDCQLARARHGDRRVLERETPVRVTLTCTTPGSIAFKP